MAPSTLGITWTFTRNLQGGGFQYFPTGFYVSVFGSEGACGERLFDDRMNYMDFLCCGGDLLASGSIWQGNANSQAIGALRLVRFTRALRILKHFLMFRVLYMMVAGMRVAVFSVFICCCFLGLTLVVWAIFGVTFLPPLEFEARINRYL